MDIKDYPQARGAKKRRAAVLRRRHDAPTRRRFVGVSKVSTNDRKTIADEIADDVLFVHTADPGASTGHVISVPMGVLALADLLKNRNIQTQIVHLETERAADPHFDLSDYALKRQTRIFCLDLHWHHQSFAVLKLAEDLKKKVGGARIVVGGMTASIFSRSILKNCSSIDFIIRGDGEIPLLELIATIKSGKQEFGRIPNLTWRKGRSIVSNPHSYHVTEKILSQLSYANFSLMKNYQVYMDLDKDEDPILGAAPAFRYNCGRGCSFICSYCGGSRLSQSLIYARTKPVFIPQAIVRRDLKRAYSFGLRRWMTSFNPQGSERYYKGLFKKIAEEKLAFSISYDAWSLPSKNFLKILAGTFLRPSRVIFSPETGSEKIRQLNKACSYTNTELLEALKACDQSEIQTTATFTAGLPFETTADIHKTIQFITILRKDFPRTQIKAYAQDIDPFSPMHLLSKTYGIHVSKKRFLDYYRAAQSHNPHDLGYCSDFLTQKKILQAVQIYRRYGASALIR